MVWDCFFVPWLGWLRHRWIHHQHVRGPLLLRSRWGMLLCHSLICRLPAEWVSAGTLPSTTEYILCSCCSLAWVLHRCTIYIIYQQFDHATQYVFTIDSLLFAFFLFLLGYLSHEKTVCSLAEEFHPLGDQQRLRYLCHCWWCLWSPRFLGPLASGHS